LAETKPEIWLGMGK